VTINVPNVFIQTDMEKTGCSKDIIKIHGPLVEKLVVKSQNYIHCEPILYVELLKELYSTFQAALLFCKKLKKDLAAIRFKINPYDPCAANHTSNGKKHTVMLY
jgi:uroporphyrinogen-III decarboxylase